MCVLLFLQMWKVWRILKRLESIKKSYVKPLICTPAVITLNIQTNLVKWFWLYQHCPALVSKGKNSLPTLSSKIFLPMDFCMNCWKARMLSKTLTAQVVHDVIIRWSNIRWLIASLDVLASFFLLKVGIPHHTG